MARRHAVKFSQTRRKRHISDMRYEKATSQMRTYSAFPFSDLDRPFCHPVAMISPGVTPMHHLTIVVSTAVPGRPVIA
jgi:hypothetical protein